MNGNAAELELLAGISFGLFGGSVTTMSYIMRSSVQKQKKSVLLILGTFVVTVLIWNFQTNNLAGSILASFLISSIGCLFGFIIGKWQNRSR